ncbi:hypothetical protein LZ30DRAFT_685009 [Colletotrichum cereale]|nr:hypothetical protein LZ30DRAFT_685009 [Colletotrichum cereale]
MSSGVCNSTPVECFRPSVWPLVGGLWADPGQELHQVWTVNLVLVCTDDETDHVEPEAPLGTRGEASSHTHTGQACACIATSSQAFSAPPSTPDACNQKVAGNLASDISAARTIECRFGAPDGSCSASLVVSARKTDRPLIARAQSTEEGYDSWNDGVASESRRRCPTAMLIVRQPASNGVI